MEVHIYHQSGETETFEQYAGDSGFDLKAYIKEDIILEPGQIKLINTGISLKMPKDLEAQIRPRSRLAMKQGITVLNSPGRVDSGGYRGEIKVILMNHGQEDFLVKNGDRIAQRVFLQIPGIELKNINKVTRNKERGEKGFGSTDTSFDPSEKTQ